MRNEEGSQTDPKIAIWGNGIVIKNQCRWQAMLGIITDRYEQPDLGLTVTRVHQRYIPIADPQDDIVYRFSGCD